LPCHQSHSYSEGASLRDMPKGRAVAPPLSRAANKSTAEDIRIDVDVWCAHNLVSSSGGSSRRRRSSGGVEPSKCLEREHVERRPAEVERIEPAKRRAVSSKGGYTAFCIGRESADGLIHSGLGSSDKVLCASGCAWARGSRRGQLIKRELGEAADPAVYTLLLLL